MSHSAASSHTHDHAHHDGAEDHPHVTPLRPMAIVFGVLLFLTFLTVVQSRIPTTIMSETLHIIAAIAIASIKALLVAAYFMHLRYDKPINTVVVSATLFAVVLFLGFTMLDLASRKWIDPVEQGEKTIGGDAHYVTQPDGSRVRQKGGLGVVAAAKEKGHHDDTHGDDAHGHDDAHAQPEGSDGAAGDSASGAASGAGGAGGH